MRIRYSMEIENKIGEKNREKKISDNDLFGLGHEAVQSWLWDTRRARNPGMKHYLLIVAGDEDPAG